MIEPLLTPNEFSQFGKIIRYRRSSIMQFFEDNRMGLDRF
ncbi:MAG: hypothetical protein ACJA1C_002168 [Crocinitomicaceae bacterium]|jgi:hypothetical protein